MAFPRRLQQLVDFILNEASDQEIDVLQAALTKRTRDRGPTDARNIKFGNMAEEITQGIQQRYAMPGQEHIVSMTRSMVKSIIQTHEPDISPADLEALLEHYAPTPGAAESGSAGSAGKEREIPLDMLASMITQFLEHGQGKMPAAALRDLQQSMPDWTERYWNSFSQETRELITARLTGRIDDRQFWETFQANRSG